MRASPAEDAPSPPSPLQATLCGGTRYHDLLVIMAAARTGGCVGPFVHHASQVLQALVSKALRSHARELLTGPGCDAPTDLPQQGLRHAFHLRLALKGTKKMFIPHLDAA